MLSKAQFLSVDFFVAIGALFFSLLIVLLSWKYLADHGTAISLHNDLQRIAHQSSVSLVSTAGIPLHWHNSSSDNVSAVGLTDASGQLLSMEKLYALNRTDLDMYELLGVLGPGYDYYIEAFHEGDSFFLDGDLPSSDASYVVVREYMLFNGTDPILVRFGVWT